MTLFERLADYSRSGALPMHMPGHKRNVGAFPWLAGLGGGVDITEIEGFDNLNDPRGVFLELGRRLAALRGAEESIPLVGGSTLGILSSVRAVLGRGGGLLMARGSHMSLYHASELCGAEVRYLLPDVHPVLGCWGPVEPGDVEAALASWPEAGLVAVTSPTYEGVISDIAAISEVCHRHGLPLLVDGAHGAHLGFEGFPECPTRLGADIVVESLHKTLPSLTGTAALHMRGGLVDRDDVRRNVRLLQTSSPSYILSASIEGCVDFLEREGNTASRRWREALDAFYGAVRDLERLKVREDWGFPLHDPSKIVISCAGTDLEGHAFAGLLRERWGVELEMASPRYALAMTGMGDTGESLGRLASALRGADGLAGSAPTKALPGRVKLPERRLQIPEALKFEAEPVPTAAAVGRVLGEYLWEYPPGSPLIVPGETADEDIIGHVLGAADIKSERGMAPEYIFCLRGY